MIILLPTIRPHHTIPAKIGITLFNWMAWIIPALADATADDVGEHYQWGLTLLVACWIAISIALLLFGAKYFATLLVVGMEVGIYLVFGIFYHLYQRSWH